jgi:hypothetical protein
VLTSLNAAKAVQLQNAFSLLRQQADVFIDEFSG